MPVVPFPPQENHTSELDFSLNLTPIQEFSIVIMIAMMILMTTSDEARIKVLHYILPLTKKMTTITVTVIIIFTSNPFTSSSSIIILSIRALCLSSKVSPIRTSENKDILAHGVLPLVNYLKRLPFEHLTQKQLMKTLMMMKNLQSCTERRDFRS